MLTAAAQDQLAIQELGFWQSKGVNSAAEYIAKVGAIPSNPYAFFGISSSVSGSEQGKVIFDREWSVGSSDAEMQKQIQYNPDQPWFPNSGAPGGRYPANLAWPITGNPLADWNNAHTARFGGWALGGERPSPWRWTDPGKSPIEVTGDWSEQYGAVFPTLQQYADAYAAVVGSGQPVTQEAVTQQFTETITANPEEAIVYTQPTVSGAIRPDSSLPTEGPTDTITTVPVPGAGGTLAIVPTQQMTAPKVQTEPVAVKPAATVAPSPESVKFLFDWRIWVGVGVIILVALAMSRRRR